MNLARTLFSLALALVLTGCASTTSSGGSGGGGPAAASEAGDADALRDKERELDYAKRRLDIEHVKAEQRERGEQAALVAAERELELARGELENFGSVAQPLEIVERELSLDRSRQRTLEAEQELGELEAMYAKEDFAETTKELVLTRGRAQLEMARRALEIAERELEQLRTFEHPRREQKLMVAVEDAERGLQKAQVELRLGQLERDLSLLEAKHGIEDLERELSELRSGAAGG